ncbi:MAG: hypothetical protein RIQ60_3470 [Pseudomonadota bacterium]
MSQLPVRAPVDAPVDPRRPLYRPASGAVSVRSSLLLLAITAALLLPGCVIAPPERHVVVHAGGYYPPAPRRAQVVEAPPPAVNAMPPLYFYPERGQSDEQLDRDRYECYRWAVRETGTDPGMTPTMRSIAEPATGPVSRDPGVAVAGAATGAVIGAAISSPRNTGRGMVLGAIFGGLLGASAEEARAQETERSQDARRRDWQARENARLQPVEGFRRAMSACMSGRGYAVR